MIVRTTFDEFLLRKETSSNEIITSKDLNMMLQIPIVPHSESGEEEGILQIVCPSETDLLFGYDSDQCNDPCNQAQEEIRCAHTVDDERSPDEVETRNSADSDDDDDNDRVLLHDDFFADMREREERHELQRISSRPRQIEFDKQIKNEVAKKEESSSQDHELYMKDTKPLTQSQQPTVGEMYNTNSNYSLQLQSRSFEQNVRTALDTGRQVPVFTLQHTFSNESESSYSVSSSMSAVSYSSASVMKLKARKRILEKHHSSKKYLFNDTISINEVNTCNRNHCAAVTVA